MQVSDGYTVIRIQCSALRCGNRAQVRFLKEVLIKDLCKEWNNFLKCQRQKEKEKREGNLNEAKKMLKLLKDYPDVGASSCMEDSEIVLCNDTGTEAKIINYKEVLIKGLEAYIKEETENVN